MLKAEFELKTLIKLEETRVILSELSWLFVKSFTIKGLLIEFGQFQLVIKTNKEEINV